MIKSAVRASTRSQFDENCEFLADTNILLSLAEPRSPHHPPAKNAVEKLIEQSDVLFVTLQNASEFWNVCTHPIENSGFGFSPARSDAELLKIETIFDSLPDTEDGHEYWRRSIVDHTVSGVRVHYAKLVASMLAHRIPNLLTFNVNGFKRYKDIAVFDPKNL